MLVPVIENLYFSPVKSISFTNSKSLIVKKNIGIKTEIYQMDESKPRIIYTKI